MVTITIDDQDYSAEDGMTVLEVARKHNLPIPTLCYHPSLKPSGSCRLCAVEVPGRSSGRQVTMLACVLKVKDGLNIKTRSEAVDRARTRAFRKLLQMAPQAEALVALAGSYDIDTGPPPDGCVRCRLCIRVCKDIVGPGALKMEKIDGRNFVVPIEGQCIGCGTCANICPTDAITIQDRNNVRTISIRREVIGTHPLERCEGCGKQYATPKFLNHIHRRTSTHTDVKAHHTYCPTCAKLFSDRIKTINDRSQR